MSKKQIKTIIITGIVWVLCLIAGITYSLLYNEGRWVKEMSLNDYVFSVKDIPMLAVGVLIALWVLYVVIVTFKTVFKPFSSQDNSTPTYTRKIPPVLCVFGICGFLGFLGFGLIVNTALFLRSCSSPSSGCSDCFLRGNSHTLWKMNCSSKTRLGQT